MSNTELVKGYLEVKVSAKSRRGLMPWKAWQKQWCEIKKLDNIENGLELKLKSSSDGIVLHSVILPRSSTICRTESRTKQYAFGVFTLGKNQKPLLFLSGNSESDSQKWMCEMRRMLCIASYLPVGDSAFHVSLVDTNHSRAAGLTGLYGVLGTNCQEIIISDPCTGDHKISWKWYQFHQFHLQAAVNGVDEKVICVMHTSGEFPSGPGQLYLYCRDSPRLLNHLISRGKRIKTNNSSHLIGSRRLSRSEGDLYSDLHHGNKALANCHVMTAPDSPLCFRNSEGGGSEDSGVRVSIGSSEDFVLKSKMASSLISIGMALLTKTPGGSETNGDSLLDLSINETDFLVAPRRESGVSMASGIYEEIPEGPSIHKSKEKNDSSLGIHFYENPIDIILNGEKNAFKPPPLPPRIIEITDQYTAMGTPYKHRCNTLPAKDLQRISQIFTSDSDYMVMSPSKKAIDVESTYVQMSPRARLKAQVENCYMIMTGKK